MLLMQPIVCSVFRGSAGNCDDTAIRVASFRTRWDHDAAHSMVVCVCDVHELVCGDTHGGMVVQEGDLDHGTVMVQ